MMVCGHVVYDGWRNAWSHTSVVGTCYYYGDYDGWNKKPSHGVGDLDLLAAWSPHGV